MAGRKPPLDPLIHSIKDLEEYASRNLAPKYANYIAGGSMDMITLKDNVEEYNRYRILPRALRNVKNIDTSAEIYGFKSKFPLGISPTGFHVVAHPQKEKATSRAAKRVGVPMCISSRATTSVQDIIQARPRSRSRSTDEHSRIRIRIPYAMQLCVMKDYEANLYVIRKAEEAGCKVLWITVDLPVTGRRLGELKFGFGVPDGEKIENMPEDFDYSLDWDKIKWFKNHTKMEIWLKGVMHPEDARLALQYGVDGIIISNHGGRQLDSIPSTLSALPRIVDGVGGKIPVHIDGGIRRGSDIFKALALGADYCWVGRPVMWGLAYRGEDGVKLALDLLYEEFLSTMILVGVTRVADISRRHLAWVNADGSLRYLEDENHRYK
uniref:FMN hydroxy acid dehydrogenase domain-containing protein n=1 Tax=Kwoniella dejecticola CBS 10117 TaxID=1296121 RepID=A0A1A5ZTF3_9TREE|nr:uncharacterized protein I303_08485 [Kwoniella dejecticola CBS 10117]OBR81103.1 hypothetical protein I303_08485 [Kwoniella dejecticola CBS 10117]